MNLNKISNSFLENNQQNDILLDDNDILFKSVSENSILKSPVCLPTYVNHRSITTKPEDQGSTGTCAMYTSTTVVEMLLWKFLGEYKEFSYDEIMNIYLDVQAGYKNSLYTTAHDRCLLRGTDGQWSDIVNSMYDNGENTMYISDKNESYSGLGLITRNLAYSNRLKDLYLKYRAYYWIMRYNDPAVRINHYPDKFSEICFKAKNYIIDNIYRYRTKNGTISPEKIKRIMFLSQNPMRVGIYGVLNSQGYGHATAMLGYTDDSRYSYGSTSVYHSAFLNSSWDSNEYSVLQFPFNKDHLDDDDTNSYYDCIRWKNGKVYSTDKRFNHGIINVDFFDRRLESNTQKNITILKSENGKIIGINKNEKVKNGMVIQLLAKPYDGQYFKRWLINNKTVSNGFDNPISITVNEDMTIQAEYSSSKVVRNVKLVVPYGKTEKYYGTNNVSESDIELYFKINGLPSSKTITYDWLYNNTAILSYNSECSYGTTLSLTAVSVSNDKKFVEWNDGNKNISRSITLVEDTILYPIFKNAIDFTGCTVSVGYYGELYGITIYNKRCNKKSTYYVLKYGTSIKNYVILNKNNLSLYSYNGDFNVINIIENKFSSIDSISFTATGKKLEDQTLPIKIDNIHRIFGIYICIYDNKSKVLLNSNDYITFSSSTSLNPYPIYSKMDTKNLSLNTGDKFDFSQIPGFMSGDTELNEDVIINYTIKNATIDSCELYQGYYYTFGTPNASCKPTLTNGCISFKMTEKPNTGTNASLILIVRINPN